MKKKDMVDVVAKDLKISKTVVEAVVDSVIRYIAEAMRTGSTVELHGFGQFFRRKVKAYQGMGGEIPPHYRVYFKPGSKLKGFPLRES